METKTNSLLWRNGATALGLKKVNLKEQANGPDEMFWSRLGTFLDHNIQERNGNQKLMAPVDRGKHNSNKTAKGARF